MTEVMKNPIGSLVIGEEWLSKLACYLETIISSKNVEDVRASKQTFLQSIEKLIQIFKNFGSDLTDTNNKIRENREVVYTLVKQFDRIGRFCMSEIPTVVQKEHDQASNTLATLRWNIKKHRKNTKEYLQG
ncbi:unnamed protein product [Heterobilharzia americana]|nr:unnamed protein product [Heterobilharzia americana]